MSQDETEVPIQKQEKHQLTGAKIEAKAEKKKGVEGEEISEGTESDTANKSEGSIEVNGSDSTDTDPKEEQIFKNVDISPRVERAVKSARNGKKQGAGGVAQPRRVQPKRRVSSRQLKSQ
ncbi:hypothetical protein HAX54_053160 [Datura stramonium]|uniref:Uncharacterized protein n=1 Tax=Datura stramonium TaxID=4076 RepID=A0ABS8SZX5_DATST|nr:hypothetical protein [Datura stramonium]